MSLHVVPDPEPPSLGDAIAYWADNATQDAVDRADATQREIDRSAQHEAERGA